MTTPNSQATEWPESDDMVVMSAVCKRYEHFNLEPLNLRVGRGEILGLVGPNGAGKSTCLRLLMGFTHPDSGTIQVLGHSIPQQSVAIKQDVAYISEDMRLYPDETLAWHIRFVKQFFPKWDDQFCQQLLKKFELKVEQKVKALSLGQRIKSVLLLALARRAKLLVLDEPSTGLDPVARYELTNTLMEIMLDEESSVIFSSQFTQDVERLSDKIAFMDHGRLIDCEDKENYLDSWKTLELRCNTTLPNFSGLVDKQVIAGGFSVVHKDYSKDLLLHYQQLGCEVLSVSNMTLEEIFIRQVLARRSQEKAGDPYGV